MAFKNREKSGGRVKGTPNKVTKELKEMILGALDDAGGQKYLAEQAHISPSAFLALVGKVLPSQVKVDMSLADQLKDMPEEIVDNEIERLAAETAAIVAVTREATKTLN